jgi:hypothetical protein
MANGAKDRLEKINAKEISEEAYREVMILAQLDVLEKFDCLPCETNTKIGLLTMLMSYFLKS